MLKPAQVLHIHIKHVKGTRYRYKGGDRGGSYLSKGVFFLLKSDCQSEKKFLNAETFLKLWRGMALREYHGRANYT